MNCQSQLGGANNAPDEKAVLGWSRLVMQCLRETDGQFGVNSATYLEVQR